MAPAARRRRNRVLSVVPMTDHGPTPLERTHPHGRPAAGAAPAAAPALPLARDVARVVPAHPGAVGGRPRLAGGGLDGGPAALSLVTGLSAGGMLASTLIGGALADRVPQRRILLVVALLQAGVVGVAAVLSI